MLFFRNIQIPNKIFRQISTWLLILILIYESVIGIIQHRAEGEGAQQINQLKNKLFIPFLTLARSILNSDFSRI